MEELVGMRNECTGRAVQGVKWKVHVGANSAATRTRLPAMCQEHNSQAHHQDITVIFRLRPALSLSLTACLAPESEQWLLSVYQWMKNSLRFNHAIKTAVENCQTKLKHPFLLILYPSPKPLPLPSQRLSLYLASWLVYLESLH